MPATPNDSPAGPVRAASRRRDAARNREILAAAARKLFAREGLNVPLDRIAKAAGVGNATLYRHFPTREALIEEIFADTRTVFDQAAADALAEPDGWRALHGYFERIFTLVAGDRGLNDLVTATARDSRFLAELSESNAATVATLVARAQEQHTVRSDVTTMDLLILMGPLVRAMPALTEQHPDGWRRPLALLLDAFRPAGATHALPGAPVGSEHLEDTFYRLWEA
ncbi:TetR/AcrR family transcriptional regulator [Kitasatospora sp. NPDC057936]|uniref:TetR/AcrR family transcriptional regulator n=1 Tax=Kitasatospora sp. NPDC057936 TaxID=3346283 RepID=UPI0036DC0502